MSSYTPTTRSTTVTSKKDADDNATSTMLPLSPSWYAGGLSAVYSSFPSCYSTAFTTTHYIQICYSTKTIPISSVFVVATTTASVLTTKKEASTSMTAMISYNSAWYASALTTVDDSVQIHSTDSLSSSASFATLTTSLNYMSSYTPTTRSTTVTSKKEASTSMTAMISYNSAWYASALTTVDDSVQIHSTDSLSSSASFATLTTSLNYMSSYTPTTRSTTVTSKKDADDNATSTMLPLSPSWYAGGLSAVYSSFPSCYSTAFTTTHYIQICYSTKTIPISSVFVVATTTASVLTTKKEASTSMTAMISYNSAWYASALTTVDDSVQIHSTDSLSSSASFATLTTSLNYMSSYTPTTRSTTVTSKKETSDSLTTMKRYDPTWYTSALTTVDGFAQVDSSYSLRSLASHGYLTTSLSYNSFISPTRSSISLKSSTENTSEDLTSTMLPLSQSWYTDGLTTDYSSYPSCYLTAITSTHHSRICDSTRTTAISPIIDVGTTNAAVFTTKKETSDSLTTIKRYDPTWYTSALTTVDGFAQVDSSYSLRSLASHGYLTTSLSYNSFISPTRSSISLKSSTENTSEDSTSTMLPLSQSWYTDGLTTDYSSYPSCYLTAITSTHHSRICDSTRTTAISPIIDVGTTNAAVFTTKKENTSEDSTSTMLPLSQSWYTDGLTTDYSSYPSCYLTAITSTHHSRICDSTRTTAISPIIDVGTTNAAVFTTKKETSDSLTTIKRYDPTWYTSALTTVDGFAQVDSSYSLRSLASHGYLTTSLSYNSFISPTRSSISLKSSTENTSEDSTSTMLPLSQSWYTDGLTTDYSSYPSCYLTAIISTHHSRICDSTRTTAISPIIDVGTTNAAVFTTKKETSDSLTTIKRYDPTWYTSALTTVDGFAQVDSSYSLRSLASHGYLTTSLSYNSFISPTRSSISLKSSTENTSEDSTSTMLPLSQSWYTDGLTTDYSSYPSCYLTAITSTHHSRICDSTRTTAISPIIDVGTTNAAVFTTKKETSDSLTTIKRYDPTWYTSALTTVDGFAQVDSSYSLRSLALHGYLTTSLSYNSFISPTRSSISLKSSTENTSEDSTSTMLPLSQSWYTDGLTTDYSSYPSCYLTAITSTHHSRICDSTRTTAISPIIDVGTTNAAVFTTKKETSDSLTTIKRYDPTWYTSALTTVDGFAQVDSSYSLRSLASHGYLTTSLSYNSFISPTRSSISLKSSTENTSEDSTSTMLPLSQSWYTDGLTIDYSSYPSCFLTAITSTHHSRICDSTRTTAISPIFDVGTTNAAVFTTKKETSDSLTTMKRYDPTWYTSALTTVDGFAQVDSSYSLRSLASHGYLTTSLSYNSFISPTRSSISLKSSTENTSEDLTSTMLPLSQSWYTDGLTTDYSSYPSCYLTAITSTHHSRICDSTRTTAISPIIDVGTTNAAVFTTKKETSDSLTTIKRYDPTWYTSALTTVDGFAQVDSSYSLRSLASHGYLTTSLSYNSFISPTRSSISLKSSTENTSEDLTSTMLPLSQSWYTDGLTTDYSSYPSCYLTAITSTHHSRICDSTRTTAISPIIDVGTTNAAVFTTKKETSDSLTTIKRYDPTWYTSALTTVDGFAQVDSSYSLRSLASHGYLTTSLSYNSFISPTRSSISLKSSTENTSEDSTSTMLPLSQSWYTDGLTTDYSSYPSCYLTAIISTHHSRICDSTRTTAISPIIDVGTTNAADFTTKKEAYDSTIIMINNGTSWYTSALKTIDSTSIYLTSSLSNIASSSDRLTSNTATENLNYITSYSTTTSSITLPSTNEAYDSTIIMINNGTSWYTSALKTIDSTSIYLTSSLSNIASSSDRLTSNTATENLNYITSYSTTTSSITLPSTNDFSCALAKFTFYGSQWSDQYVNKSSLEYSKMTSKLLDQLKKIFVSAMFTNKDVQFYGNTSVLVKFTYQVENPNKIENCKQLLNLNLPEVSLTPCDCCTKETVGEESLTGLYTLPITLVNNVYTLPCVYNNSIMLEQHCVINNSNKMPEWEHFSHSNCPPKSGTTLLLYDISKVDITESNIQNVSYNLSQIIQNGNLTTEYDIQLISITLKHIITFKSSLKMVLEYILRSIDNMLSSNSSLFKNTNKVHNLSTEFLHLLDHLGRQQTDNVNISLKNLGFSSYIRKQSNNSVYIYSKEHEDKVGVVISSDDLKNDLKNFNNYIVLPSQLFTEKYVQIYSYIFKNKSFFMEEDGTIESVILSASLNGIDVKNLSSSISIKFTSETNNPGKRTCSHYKIEEQKWSSSGCNTISISSSKIECHCNHLTNFAQILNIDQSITESLGLNFVTWIGCGVSIVGLFITIFSHFFFRSLRQKLAPKILIILCTNLLCTLVIFLSLVEQTKNRILCKIVASFLQFFVLSTFFWMAIEGFNLYRMFVKVLGASSENFLLKCSAFAWGLPLLFTIATGLSKPDSLGPEAEKSLNLCVVQGLPFYFGVLLPVCVVMVFNIVMLVLVIRGIDNNSSPFNKVKSKKKVRIAFACSLLLGTTWVFAVLAVGKFKTVFQWLFCIFNSLQGFFIFLFYAVNNQKLKEHWLSYLYEKFGWRAKKYEVINLNLANSNQQIVSNSQNSNMSLQSSNL
ncbi:serine-rich adhesin for platelets isoform X3 [Hydra vulgaris]|uniref:serine-rich adhesin for platelets isoform X3 n=1 Tax=Hydra vulgaris TaxID=6087 RepID=UPI0032EA2BA3